MKLLLCPECSDVFNLKAEVKTCTCGATRGCYTDDLNAVYTRGIPLGFANSSFLAAVDNQPETGMGETFEAFVIPKDCPTFKPTKFHSPKPLVTVLAEAAGMSMAMARRRVVQGAVKVNDKVVDDPAARLCDEPGHPSRIEYNGTVYPFYP